MALSLTSMLATASAAVAAGSGTGMHDPPPQGSTRGVLTSAPNWGAGLQIGSYSGSGITAQRVGVYGGAINLSLGFGLGDSGLSVAGDYIRFFGMGFTPMTVRDGGYNNFRGQLNPYLGGGVRISADGVQIRVPVGLQYTMLRDPYTFFGGLALVLGPFLGGDDASAQLWFNIGARVLL